MLNKLKAFYDSVGNQETVNLTNTGQQESTSVSSSGGSNVNNNATVTTTTTQTKVQQTSVTTGASKVKKDESKFDTYLSPISNFLSSSTSTFSNYNEKRPPLKYRYSRPQFLQLATDDEIQVSADHSIRPIIVPRDINKLPWNSGYAETINAGKSARNEDQASICRGLLRAIISPDEIANQVIDMMPTVTLTPNKLSSSKSETVPILTSPTTPLPVEALEVNEEQETKTDSVDDENLIRSSAQYEESLPWQYFGIFDGHAGSGVAVAASNALHKLVQEKLQNIASLLIAFGLRQINNSVNEKCKNGDGGGDDEENEEFVDLTTKLNETKINYTKEPISHDGSLIVNHQNNLPNLGNVKVFQPSMTKLVTVDSLIIGALELAFWEMDHQIALDKKKYRMSGGCTALVALFILGKLYVANAGDSRAIAYKNSQIIPMSFDFTPESERERIKLLGLIRPDYLGNDFTHLEFIRKPTRRDIGKKLLYKDAFMTGWAYKTITSDDLKIPLIYGEGKRSRVLVTIGVTRGFGDHELTVQNGETYLKPFLTPQPQVKVMDLENEKNLSDSDVLIMGTDGLWDITSNEKAVSVVQKSLDHFPANDTVRFKYRYISAAQDLVMHSRGKSRENGKGWRTSDNFNATIDDISVFVIPLKPYQQEFLKWKEAHLLVKNSKQ